MPHPHPPGPRIALVIDYQNIHLTAAERFCPPGIPLHQSLIHPGHFADVVLSARARSQRETAYLEEAKRSSVGAVHVFRGLPDSGMSPEGYRRNLAQQSNWQRDRRVHVEHRKLAYNSEGVPREKGIDVLLALKLITLTRTAEFSVVILASHDTDLEPALDYAIKEGRARIETAGWVGCKRLHPSQSKIWHTFLEEADFGTSLDPHPYS